VGATGTGKRYDRIAVLYFRHQTDDPDLTYIAAGLTEALIDTLRRVPDLAVVSKGGVAPYRQSTVGADSIARALGVAALLSGALEGSADQFTVLLQLIDRSGRPEDKPRSIRGPLRDMRLLQDSIASAALSLLGRTGSRPPSAWMLVQRARQARIEGDSLLRANDTAGYRRAFAAAESLAASAEALEPDSWEPLVIRATLAYRRTRHAPNDTSIARRETDAGLRYVNRALQVAPNNLDAIDLRAHLSYWRWLLSLDRDTLTLNGLLRTAQGDLEKVVRARPSQAESWVSLSHVYYQTGSLADVKKAAQKAYELDPFLSNADVVISRLFYASYDLAEFNDASRWCSEGRRRFPADAKFVVCKLYLLTTPATTPDVRLAWVLADSATRLASSHEREYQRLEGRMMVAATLARAGLSDSSRRVAERSRGSGEIDPTRDLAYAEAFVHTLRNDPTAAIEALRIYLAANPGKRASIAEDPSWWFRDLSRDPRFSRLVKE
jgi:TolB-like protein